jgi:hypothetical protein
MMLAGAAAAAEVPIDGLVAPPHAARSRAEVREIARSKFFALITWVIEDSYFLNRW